MINVNHGHNKELLDKCRPLGEYSFFLDNIKNFSRKGCTTEEAVSMSIDKLSNDSILKPFLMANREEVCHMILTEYNEEKFAEAMKEEGREEGLRKGEGKGLREGTIKLYKGGYISEEIAANNLNMTVDKFKELPE